MTFGRGYARRLGCAILPAMDRRTIVSGTLGLALVACAAGVIETGTEAPIVVHDPLPEGATGSQIVGFVADKDSGDAVAGAIVVIQCTCLQGQRETQSNADGVYAFRNLPPGDYTVQALHGKGDASQTLTLGEGQRARLRFRLNPKPARILT